MTNMLGNGASLFSVNKFSKSIFIFPLYFLLNPFIVYFVMKKHSGATTANYFELIALYGYSMTVFLCLEICLLVPLTLFKYLATGVAAAISLFFLKKEILDLTQKQLPGKDLTFLVYYGAGSHVLLILLLKWYFFN